MEGGGEVRGGYDLALKVLDEKQFSAELRILLFFATYFEYHYCIVSVPYLFHFRPWEYEKLNNHLNSDLKLCSVVEEIYRKGLLLVVRLLIYQENEVITFIIVNFSIYNIFMEILIFTRISGIIS